MVSMNTSCIYIINTEKSTFTMEGCWCFLSCSWPILNDLSGLLIYIVTCADVSWLLIYIWPIYRPLLHDWVEVFSFNTEFSDLTFTFASYWPLIYIIALIIYIWPLLVGPIGGVPGSVYSPREENERWLYSTREKIPQGQETHQGVSVPVSMIQKLCYSRLVVGTWRVFSCRGHVVPQALRPVPYPIC